MVRPSFWEKENNLAQNKQKQKHKTNKKRTNKQKQKQTKKTKNKQKQKIPQPNITNKTDDIQHDNINITQLIRWYILYRHSFYNIMKKQQYHTVGTVPKSIIKIVERGKNRYL